MKISAIIITLTSIALLLKISEQKRINEVIKNNQGKVFQNFKSKYKRKYRDESQQLYRNLVVYKNANKIAQHNLNITPYIQNKRSYQMSMNLFADMSEQQFKVRYTGYTLPNDRIKQRIQIEQKKQQLFKSKSSCLCDSNLTSFIQEVKNIQNLTNRDIKSMVDKLECFKKERKEQIDRKIGLFLGSLDQLEEDQYDVTYQKIKQLLTEYNQIQPNFMKKIINDNPSLLQDIMPQKGFNVRRENRPRPSLPRILRNPSRKLQGVQEKQYQQQIIISSLGDKEILSLLQNRNGPLSSTLIRSNSTNPTNTSTANSISSNNKSNTSIYSSPAPAPVPVPTFIVTLAPSNTNSNSTTSSTTTSKTPNAVNSATSIKSAASSTKNTTSREISFNINTFSVDWSNYTGPVRQQGQCGSCYALVAVNNLQALLAIYVLGFHIQLSPQQIIECSQNGLTFGCGSGYLEGSFLFMKDKGISTEYIYPYTSMETGYVSPCKLENGPFKINSFKNLIQGDCVSLKKQLAKKPVSVAISSQNLQFYSSGVFTGCTMKVDHAVLLVGFSQQKGWKIKNTWGPLWGQGGYAWIQDGNNCGICEGPTVPSVAGQPNSIGK